ARALMSRPRLLLLDEPTMGLSPALCAEVYSFIKQGRQKGLTVLVSGEGAKGLAAVCDRTATIVNGVLG
ncbi:MAG: ABC transporter ATP-binding protein, partial [Acetanaerobacterium sp.]